MAFRALAEDIGAEDFDFEAATNFLSTLARLRNTEIQLSDNDLWIARIARRFCVSKSSTDMLCVVVQSDEDYAAIIRTGHASISAWAERAMACNKKGAYREAVTGLLQSSLETLNAKLVDLAGLVLNRHSEHIEGSALLAEEIVEIKRKYCSKGMQISIGKSASRQAGALPLRS
jgi:hypothetical protein